VRSGADFGISICRFVHHAFVYTHVYIIYRRPLCILGLDYGLPESIGKRSKTLLPSRGVNFDVSYPDPDP
jgi:hypothetical protein